MVSARKNYDLSFTIIPVISDHMGKKQHKNKSKNLFSNKKLNLYYIYIYVRIRTKERRMRNPLKEKEKLQEYVEVWSKNPQSRKPLAFYP